MSALTLALLQRKTPRQARRWHSRIQKITDLLVAEYGTPSLGNYRDPIREIFYIVLSAKTTESLYRLAYKRLWTRFHTLSEIANASLAEIRRCVAHAGLGAKRSAQLRAIASRLCADFGSRPGQGLRKLSAEEAFAYLRSLPGVGPKSALCVMMYSLGFDVFPVDAHVHRVLCRVGAMRRGAKHYHAQDRLPAFVPAGRSKELHVALVVHGRLICRSRSPRCDECPIIRLCATGTRHRTADGRSLRCPRRRAC